MAATVLDDLPECLVADDILSRLPSKDVLRCRAVRTSWRRATATPDFLLAHRARQPSLPLIYHFPSADDLAFETTYGVLRDGDAVAGAAGAAKSKLSSVLRYATNGKNWLAVHGACDGLLLVSSSPSLGAPGKHFFVCNPATRHCAPLPQLERRPSISIAGFYKDLPSEEYRVLYWIFTEEVDPVYYIVTVGSDEERCLGRPSLLEEVDVDPRFAWSITYGPVLLRGCLHWKEGRHCEAETKRIVVFDTALETFRLMGGPAQLLMGRASATLLEMDGKLAVCSIADSTSIDVSVMQDYDAEVWAPTYRINLSVPLPLGDPSSNRSMVVVNKRQLLIMVPNSLVHHYDIDGKFVEKVESEQGDHFLSITSHLLQENIASFPFFQMRIEPPFHIEL